MARTVEMAVKVETVETEDVVEIPALPDRGPSLDKVAAEEAVDMVVTAALEAAEVMVAMAAPEEPVAMAGPVASAATAPMDMKPRTGPISVGKAEPEVVAETEDPEAAEAAEATERTAVMAAMAVVEALAGQEQTENQGMGMQIKTMELEKPEAPELREQMGMPHLVMLREAEAEVPVASAVMAVITVISMVVVEHRVRMAQMVKAVLAETVLPS